MYYVIFLLLLFLFFFSSLYKVTVFSNILLVFAVFCAFSLNRQNQDYDAYKLIFEQPWGYSEPGYSFLVEAIKLLGGSHEHILIMLAVLVSVTLLRYLKYSPFVGFSLLLYVCFPMPVDVVQIRNTFATFFFLNAVLFIVDRRYFLAAFFCVVAISFHVFALLYTVLVFGALLRNIYGFKFLVFIGAATVGVSLPVLIPIFLASGLFRSIEFYISEQIKLGSFLVWGGGAVFDLFLIYLLGRRLEFQGEAGRLVSVMIAVLTLGAAMSIGLLYIYEFNRVFRALIIVKYIFWSIVIPRLDYVRGGLLVFYLLLFASFFSLYYDSQLSFDYIIFDL